jgi:hypothetical protein
VVSTRYKARQKCHASLDDVTIAPAPWPTSPTTGAVEDLAA